MYFFDAKKYQETCGSAPASKAHGGCYCSFGREHHLAKGYYFPVHFTCWEKIIKRRILQVKSLRKSLILARRIALRLLRSLSSVAMTQGLSRLPRTRRAFVRPWGFGFLGWLKGFRPYSLGALGRWKLRRARALLLPRSSPGTKWYKKLVKYKIGDELFIAGLRFVVGYYFSWTARSAVQ